VYRAVVVGLPERLVELAQELHGEGVQLLRPIERDARPAALDLIDDGPKLVHDTLPTMCARHIDRE
jgi:hypothetical protein